MECRGHWRNGVMVPVCHIQQNTHRATYQKLLTKDQTEAVALLTVCV